MGRLIKMRKLSKTILRTAFYGLFIFLISCPSPLEDKLTETIENEVKEATASEYKLTIETPENGIVSISGTVSVKDDIPMQIIASPYQTHAFLNWEKVSGSGTVVFESPDKAETSFTVNGGSAVIRAVLQERPRVRYTTPTGSNVGIDARVIVKFSREMQADTITSETLIVTNADNGEVISGIISYAENTAVFEPDTDFASWTRFSVNVKRDITDTDGITLSEDYYSTSPFETRNTGDNKPPIEGTFQINSDQTWTSDLNVTLTDIFSRDLENGSVLKMFASNTDGTDWSDPITYGETANWTLSDGDGDKNVYMMFEDASGNQNNEINITGGSPPLPTGGVITDTIKLDTTGPDNNTIVSTSGEEGIAIDTNGDISVNDSFTDSQTIDLYMNAVDAGIGTSGTGDEQQIEMIIAQNLSYTQGEWDPALNDGNGDYKPAVWEAFTDDTTSRSFLVDPGDGSKVVLVKFRDSLGNESGKEFDSVKLDQTAPTGAVTINNDDIYTNQSTVNLEISGTDGGVDSGSMASADMFISNASDFSSGSWESYSDTKTGWAINTASQGDKTVYIKFRDSLGNEQINSEASSDTIIYDSFKPVSGSVVINNSAGSTNSSTLTLTISASDNSGGSGIDQMNINTSNTFPAENWEPYSASKTYTVESPPASGNPIDIYVSFRDVAGNEYDTTTPVTDSITYDTTPPAGSFTVNSGASYTKTTSVTINSTFSGVASMRFSNDNSTWTTWAAYSASSAFTLSAGDGTKTVYAQYADGAGGSGNITYKTDTIVLDTVAPVVVSSYLEGTADDDSATNLSYVTIRSNVSGSPTLMRFKNETTGSWSGWYTYSTSKTYWYLNDYNVDGTKRVYFQYRDAAGNETSLTANYDTIIQDKTAPVVSYFRIGSSANPAKINDTTPNLYSSVSDSGSGVYQMNIGNYTDPWNGWETYAATRLNWTVKDPSVDGTKRIYCYYRDKAGNTTSTSLYDTVELDTTAPTNVSVTINGGKPYAYDQTASLTITADDVPSGSEMRFRYIVGSSYIWTAYEPFSTTKTITLSDSDATKYVYVQVKDDVGNASGLYDHRDTITLDRPSINYVTKGTPGGNGKVKVYLNTVYENTAGGEDVRYRIYTSTTPTGSKTYRGYIYNSGDEIAPPAEETEYYFHVRIGHYYNSTWYNLNTYFSGPGGADRSGYAADVIIIYKDGDATDLALANELRDNTLKKDYPTSYTWASGTQPAWSVKLVPDTDIPETYSASDIIYGKPVIILPGTYHAYNDDAKDGWVRNISAGGQGIITVGSGAWILDRIEDNNDWGSSLQLPTDVGYGESAGMSGTTGQYAKIVNNYLFRTPIQSSLMGSSPAVGSSQQFYNNTTDGSGIAVYRSGGAAPTGGTIFAQYNSTGYYYPIVRQGRFLVWGWNKIPYYYYRGRLVFINATAYMDNY